MLPRAPRWNGFKAKAAKVAAGGRAFSDRLAGKVLALRVGRASRPTTMPHGYSAFHFSASLRHESRRASGVMKCGVVRAAEAPHSV
jgi:hypothetical protein